MNPTCPHCRYIYAEIGDWPPSGCLLCGDEPVPVERAAAYLLGPDPDDDRVGSSLTRERIPWDWLHELRRRFG